MQDLVVGFFKPPPTLDAIPLMFLFFYVSLCLSQYFCLFLCIVSLTSPCPLSPSGDREPSSSPAEAHSSLAAAASAYITQLAFVFQMLVCSWYPSFLPFVVPCLIPPCLSCHTLHILPHLCSLCTLSHFSVFLYHNCLFLFLSTTSLSLDPSPSAPTHLLSVLIFILSCSSPLLLSSLSHSLLFPSLPFCLFHPSLSHMLSSLTPLSAC